METILNRIEKISKNENITITSLEKSLGASKGVLSRAISKGTDIQLKWVQKFVENYPLYSSEWLLTGKGEMLKSQTSPPIIATNNTHEGIPLIPLDAMAGAFTEEISIMEYECEHYIVPDFNNADFLIRVKGDSMYPTYQSGDLVACKKVPLNNLFFQWNKTYVLDTQQGALIKRIKKGSNADHILIVSDNTDYEPFELHTSQFYNVALVVGLIRKE